MAGLRVVRGPDWVYGDQDGGMGHVGTVKECAKDTVTVIWDNGDKGTYRKGAAGQQDLRVINNSSADIRHKRVHCDACRETQLHGMRWKCAVCDDYDLCTECYGDNKHNMGHQFLRVDKEGAEGVLVGTRIGATIEQTKGIYKDAEVVRGDGWCDGSQDGGPGSLGVVVKTGIKIERGKHITGAVVKWPHTEQEYPYSLGWKGRIDLKYLIFAEGWKYYPEHLPPLDDETKLCRVEEDDDSDDNGSDDDEDQLKQALKHAQGSLMKQLAEAMSMAGSDGLPDGVLEALLEGLPGGLPDGLLEAASDLSAVKKPKGDSSRDRTRRRLKISDLVYIRGAAKDVKQLQEGHGGWDDAIEKLIGKIGIIRGIEKTGDVKVLFGENSWVLNPASVRSIAHKDINDQPRTIAPKNTEEGGSIKEPTIETGAIVRLCENADMVEKLQDNHGGWADKMKKFLGELGLVKKFDEDGDVQVCFGKDIWTFNPEALIPEHVILPNLIHGDCDTDIILECGMIVRLLEDMDKVKRHQHDHGGWNDEMKDYLGKCGVVQKIDDDGDGRVCFGEKKWFFNPAVLKLVEDGTDDERGSISLDSKGTLEKNINNIEALKVGDVVRMSADEDKVKRQQDGHGGWVSDITNYLGKRGIIQAIRPSQTQVCFGSVHNFWYNAAVLTRLSVASISSSARMDELLQKQRDTFRDIAARYQVGDIVFLSKNVGQVRKQQHGHGEWNNNIEKVLGKMGIVTEIDTEYDIRVCFGDKIWCINPVLLTLQARRGQSVGRKAPKSVNLDLMKPGKFVKLLDDADIVQTLQDKHGDWNNSMHSTLGSLGIVCKKLKDNVISVNFGRVSWHLNQAALIPWIMDTIHPPDSTDDETESDIHEEVGESSDNSSCEGEQTRSIEVDQGPIMTNIPAAANKERTGSFGPSKKDPGRQKREAGGGPAGLGQQHIMDILSQEGYSREEILQAVTGSPSSYQEGLRPAYGAYPHQQVPGNLPTYAGEPRMPQYRHGPFYQPYIPRWSLNPRQHYPEGPLGQNPMPGQWDASHQHPQQVAAHMEPHNITRGEEHQSKSIQKKFKDKKSTSQHELSSVVSEQKDIKNPEFDDRTTEEKRSMTTDSSLRLSLHSDPQSERNDSGIKSNITE